jgi:anti-sigma regulatory factor (Ser/Thr protein kinase)
MGFSDNRPDIPVQCTLPLPRDPTCAARARRFVRERLTESSSQPVDPAVVERALLTTSELVTNALRHGEGAIELRMGRVGDRMRLEVADQGDGVPAIRAEAGDETGGWGLRIVEELALRWGCFEGTTHVWAELSLTV